MTAATEPTRRAGARRAADEWEAARQQLLLKSPNPRPRRLAAERRRMPWTPVDKAARSTARTAERRCATCSTIATPARAIYPSSSEPGVRSLWHVPELFHGGR